MVKDELMLEHIEIDGKRLELWHNAEAFNPIENENLIGELYCWGHGRNLGNAHGIASPEEFLARLAYESCDSGLYEIMRMKREKVWELACKKYFIVPVFMYEGSGGRTIQMNPLSTGWNSGQLGFIFASKERIKEELHISRVTKRAKHQIEGDFREKIQLYEDWLEGRVYEMKVYESGEMVLEVEGFWGSDVEKNGMMRSAPDEFRPFLKMMSKRLGKKSKTARQH
jgi:hypothetical protein